MLFNSIPFLIFFPVVTALYFMLPHRARWSWLLLASCTFYMFYIPKYILILALTIVVDYFAALFIDKAEGKARKMYLNISILSTVAILFLFKYFNFFNENVEELARLIGWNYSKIALELALPIGLSFHTFQSLSYVIEVYRGNQKPERNFGVYSLYVMYYPQLVAGPIERPQNLLWQFHKKHDFDWDRVRSGLLRMLWGLFKKVVIADRLSIYSGMVFNTPGKHTGFTAVLATLFFTYQIYCDFSGYSDIALGASEVMGIKLMKNFDRPYTSRNLSEFWKRWHISLSTWFNDYLFNPIVVAKRDWGKWAVVAGLMTTFATSGLWHGASWSFIIWGLIHGVGLTILFLTTKWRKKVFKSIPEKLFNFLSLATTFAFVCFSYVFFASRKAAGAFTVLKSMTHGWKGGFPFNSEIETKVDLLIILIMLPLMLIMEKRFKDNPLYNMSENKPLLVQWATAWIGILVIFNFGAFSDAHSFIYFQF